MGEFSFGKLGVRTLALTLTITITITVAITSTINTTITATITITITIHANVDISGNITYDLWSLQALLIMDEGGVLHSML